MATQLANLQNLWAPCLCFGKISGLYWYSEQRSRALFWMVYSLCLLMVCSCFVFWWIYDFYILTVHGISKIVYPIMQASALLFHVHNLITFLVMFAASGGSLGFSRFYNLWTQLRFTEKEIGDIERSVRKLVSVSIVFVLLIFTIQCTVSLMENIIHGFSFQRFGSSVLSCCIQMVTLALFYLICSTLSKLFEVLNCRASADLQAHKTLQNIQDFQSNYYIIVDMVEVADNMFHVYLGSFIVLCLLQLTVKTYVAMLDEAMLFDVNLFFFLFWTCRQILFLSLLLKICIGVNSRAHASFTTFHKFLLRGHKESDQKKILSMQNFLGGVNVSFSIFKMHHITGGFLISITSIYLTYVLVLIQFIK